MAEDDESRYNDLRWRFVEASPVNPATWPLTLLHPHERGEWLPHTGIQTFMTSRDSNLGNKIERLTFNRLYSRRTFAASFLTIFVCCLVCIMSPSILVCSSQQPERHLFFKNSHPSRR